MPHRRPLALLTASTYLIFTLLPPDVLAALPAISTQPTAASTVFGSLGATQVLAFEPGASSLQPAAMVEPGQAYYVQLGSAKTWTPPLPKDPSSRFVYDGDGGKVKQTTASGTTTYLGEVYEKSSDGKIIKSVYAGSLRIATKHTTDGLRFIHGDHLGSSNVITNAAGQLVEFTEHSPYGAIHRAERAQSPEPSAPSPRFGFTGQRQDTTGTGLILFPARAYDPELGRFLQPDPFVQDPADPQTLNRYSYVRNSPHNYVDPSGNFFQLIIAAIIAVAAVAAVTSVATGVASLIASATGHERAAERLAKASQVSAYVSTPLAFVEGGPLVGAAYLISGAAVAAASDPVATAFSGPSFNTSPPTSPLQQTATAVGEYAIGVGITTAAFAALGATLRPAVPWLKKTAGPTLRKFAARWGPKLGRIGARSAAGQASRTGRPFAMGLTNQGLDEFASARGATTWKQLLDPENWKLGVLEKFADPNTPLHFNLNGVDVWQGVRRAAKNEGGATDWELLQIQQNPQVWERLQFWKNGVPVDNPFQ